MKLSLEWSMDIHMKDSKKSPIYVHLWIQIKFDIYVNNDELLKTIWEERKKINDYH
jgi:hypothetical protein